MPDNLGLVDFAIGLVNSVLNLPNGQVRYFGEFKLQKNCNQSSSSKIFLGRLNDFWASTCFSKNQLVVYYQCCILIG